MRVSENEELIDDLCRLIISIAPEPVERQDLSSETRFSEDLAMDSITLVALMYLCEEHFNIDVAANAEKIASLATIGDTVTFINQVDKLH